MDSGAGLQHVAGSEGEAAEEAEEGGTLRELRRAGVVGGQQR